MSRPPLFVELCAGLASMSLTLQHGKRCKPPVSRMGNKHGYALAILRVMGLRPGQRAEQYIWCEPDPGCRALLTAYTDPALMREAAAIIRSWKDEDPRALWERLRDEGPIRDFGAREVGRLAALHNMQQAGASLRFHGGRWEKHGGESGWGAASCRWREDGTKHDADSTTVDAPATRLDSLAEASELARYLQVTASNRLITLDPSTIANSGRGGTTFGGEFATGAERVSEAAREVARWTTVQRWSMLAKDASSFGANNFGETATSARAMDRIAGLPAAIAPDAREIHPPTLPPGCVAYMDGPYEGTTGYGNLFPRAEQAEVIRRWDEAGAACYVSEAEPIPELVADGWHAVEITSTRVGQKRTFSKQKREWLTMNRPPAWVPAVQQGLFA